MKPVSVAEGDGPIVLAMPHVGTDLPGSLRSRLNPLGQSLTDTDWWVDRLYEGLLPNLTVVKASFSRYLIDANRNPMGASLYPGQNTTEMCPTTDFDGQPIYRPGQMPGTDEIESRRRDYHAPYHHAVAEQLHRVHERHGRVVLYDAHSIRSRIPFLFDGLLPIFNIGTNEGRTCDPSLEQTVVGICRGSRDHDYTLNGRFKGGWSTRNYGRPENGCHAIQMELAQRAYMTEQPPWDFDSDLAATLRPLLRDLLQAVETQILNPPP